MTATYEAPLQIDEAIAHLSKRNLASALGVSPRTLTRYLQLLKESIEDTTELDHKPNERGYPINTAKYLILFTALVKSGMGRDRAAMTIGDQSYRGIDELIEQHLKASSQSVYDLINQLISKEKTP